jgi:hypothetical protein
VNSVKLYDTKLLSLKLSERPWCLCILKHSFFIWIDNCQNNSLFYYRKQFYIVLTLFYKFYTYTVLTMSTGPRTSKTLFEPVNFSVFVKNYIKINSRLWFRPVNSNFHFEDTYIQNVLLVKGFTEWMCSVHNKLWSYKIEMYTQIFILIQQNPIEKVYRNCPYTVHTLSLSCQVNFLVYIYLVHVHYKMGVYCTQ